MDILRNIEAEADRAAEKYGEPSSTHEGLGVLMEEVHELIDAIRANDLSHIRREAIQVAAVAARLAEACDSSIRLGGTAFGRRSR